MGDASSSITNAPRVTPKLQPKAYRAFRDQPTAASSGKPRLQSWRPRSEDRALFRSTSGVVAAAAAKLRTTRPRGEGFSQKCDYDLDNIARKNRKRGRCRTRFVASFLYQCVCIAAKRAHDVVY